MKSSSSQEVEDNDFTAQAQHQEDEEDLFPESTSSAARTTTRPAAGSDASSRTIRPSFNVQDLSPPNSQGSPLMGGATPRGAGQGGSSSPVLGRREGSSLHSASTTDDVVMENTGPAHRREPVKQARGGRHYGVGLTDKVIDDINTPGYAWRNRQAQEAYIRAMQLVVDDNFSLREFMDPSPPVKYR